MCKQYGADHVINYREDSDWVNTVKELTDGRGADVIYDPVGLTKASTRYASHRLVASQQARHQLQVAGG